MTVPFEDATSPPPHARSVGEITNLLTDPTGEAFSPVTGDPLVLVELDADADADAVAANLRHRPCVTIGLHTRGTRLPPDVDDLDVLLTHQSAPARPWIQDRAGMLDRIAAGVRANPQAAVSLSHLLRLSDQLGVRDALVAESLVYSMLLAGPEFRRWLVGRRTPRPVSEADPVNVERTDTRLLISLHRPRVHNAYSAAMRDALATALAIAAADPGIDHVLLRGDGPSFCSGGDLTEFGTTPDPATAHLVRTTRSPARLLADLTDRVVAHVHGACVGAGAELAAFAHRVVAQQDAWFQLPEIAMGLVPGAGGTASFQRRIGRHRTAALALSGDRIDAHQALDWGLVDELVN